MKNAVKRLTSNPVIIPATIFFGLYFVLDWLTDDRIFIEVVNSIQICIGIAVIVVYFPTWKRVVFGNDAMGPIHHLGLGITCAWVSMVLARAYTTLFRFTGEEALLYQYSIIGFISWIGIAGGVLHLTAPVKIKSVEIPVRAAFAIIGSFLAGCVLTVILFLTQPWIVRLTHNLFNLSG